MTTQLDTPSSTAALDDERCWQAVQEQDAAFDGAFVIPCHRAVGAGGRLTGYRWGIERKRALRARERASAT